MWVTDHAGNEFVQLALPSGAVEHRVKIAGRAQRALLARGRSGRPVVGSVDGFVFRVT